MAWGVLWGLLGRLGVFSRVSEWLSGAFWGSHGMSWVAFGLRVGASLGKSSKTRGKLGKTWYILCKNVAKIEKLLLLLMFSLKRYGGDDFTQTVRGR